MGVYELAQRLFPICRSITGDGVRQTLQLVNEVIPLELHEVATGTQVLDWQVPREWNLLRGRLIGPDGQVIVDSAQNNLHVMSYSVPIQATLSLEELQPHLFSIPEHPDWIPYRTSYYAENWGFCLTDRVLKSLRPGMYKVDMQTTLEAGSMSYGEAIIAGQTDEQIIISAHVCHPSLANDNVSGITVGAHLAQWVASAPRRYTYRFIFAPTTIGAITWLAQHRPQLHKIKGGLILSCVGDPGAFTYKQTRFGDAMIGRMVAVALRDAGVEHRIRPFSAWGYDERQYGSVGFKLPVGCFMRTPNGEYPEYHTSADNLELVTAEALGQSLTVLKRVVEIIEADRCYINLQPYGEPQLGRRGLYDAIGGTSAPKQSQLAMLWMLNQSDGQTSLLEVAEKSGMEFGLLHQMAQTLVEHELLRESDDADRGRAMHSTSLQG